jgi:4-aminobutyrate aminotransferase-like enzyme
MSRTIELRHVGVSKPWESHIHSYCQNVEAIFHTASETVMRDADRRQYIDFSSGAGSLNYAQQRAKPAVSPHRISDA